MPLGNRNITVWLTPDTSKYLNMRPGITPSIGEVNIRDALLQAENCRSYDMVLQVPPYGVFIGGSHSHLEMVSAAMAISLVAFFRCLGSKPTLCKK